MTYVIVVDENRNQGSFCSGVGKGKSLRYSARAITRRAKVRRKKSFIMVAWVKEAALARFGPDK